MSNFKNIFLDLDGTVYIDNQIINNADNQIRRLKDEGYHIYYITNNTSKNTKHYISKLKKLGLPVVNNCIISPTNVIIEWINNKNYKDIYVLGVQDLKDEISEKTGVSINPKNAECVIITYDKELTYKKLEETCKLINNGTPYFLSHLDLFCPTFNGNMPDCGSIGLMIEMTTGKKNNGHFGKPSDLMTNYIRNLIGNSDQNILIGDRIQTDVKIGKKIGAKTVVVCSGEFKNDANKNYYLDNIEIHNTLTDYLMTL
jgi:HAD superfamily hydrolase (TIGR01450 family)